MGPGQVLSVFKPADGGKQVTIDERVLTDKSSSVVVYDNPHDNLEGQFDTFQTCLGAFVFGALCFGACLTRVFVFASRFGTYLLRALPKGERDAVCGDQEDGVQVAGETIRVTVSCVREASTRERVRESVCCVFMCRCLQRVI